VAEEVDILIGSTAGCRNAVFSVKHGACGNTLGLLCADPADGALANFQFNYGSRGLYTVGQEKRLNEVTKIL
jgi:hypothetical protein